MAKVLGTKLVYIILIYVVAAISLIVTLNFISKGANDKLVSIAIYPVGTTSETYYFVLKPDNILEASMGRRGIDSGLDSNNYLTEVNKQEKVKLAEQEAKKLLALAKEFEENIGVNKKLYKDGWRVSVYYDGKLSDTYYLGNEPEIAKKLVDEVSGISPISLNLHGWS